MFQDGGEDILNSTELMKGYRLPPHVQKSQCSPEQKNTHSVTGYIHSMLQKTQATPNNTYGIKLSHASSRARGSWLSLWMRTNTHLDVILQPPKHGPPTQIYQNMKEGFIWLTTPHHQVIEGISNPFPHQLDHQAII